MDKQFKLAAVHVVDNTDVEELIDVIEPLEAPIVDKLTELGFELEEDMSEVEVAKDGVAIVSYSIYIVENEALIDVTILDSQLSEQVIKVIKQYAID